MGLVAAIKSRCPQLERGVQADAVGLSLRTFSAAERELRGSSLMVEEQDMTIRQRLSTSQLRGMAGKQIRSRVAAAIVETACEPKKWGNAGAAKVVGVHRSTVRAARKIARPCRAERRRKEADCHIMVLEREILDPDPIPAGVGLAVPPGHRKLSPSIHERTQSLRPDPEPAGAEAFVAPWRLDALFRDLGRQKRRIAPRVPKSKAEILADLEALGTAPEWSSSGHHQRRFAARMFLDAADVHTDRDKDLDPHGVIPDRQRQLGYCIADCGAPMEDLRRVAMRLARNPNVVSVGALLAKREIGAWMFRHNVDPHAIILRGDRLRQTPPSGEAMAARKESFWEMRDRTKSAREAALAAERDREDAITAGRLAKAKRMPDFEIEIEALVGELRQDRERLHHAWRIFADYRAGKSMFDIEAAHHLDIDEAHKLIQAALRASRPPMVVGADPL